MKESNSPHSFFCNNNLWKGKDNSIWLASTVSLFRNIEKFKFPAKLDAERRKQIIALLSKEFLDMKQLNHPLLFKAEELSAFEKEYLVEHFLSNQSFHSTGPGEAFLLEDTGEVMLTFNVRNHLHFTCIDVRGDLENSWNNLVKIEASLGKNISYAYSARFGFFTADLTQCGTAMGATIFLQLSGLIHMDQIDGVLEKLVDDSFVVTGIQGSPTEIIGDVLAIQNNYTIGITEETILSSLRMLATKLLVEESAVRNRIKNENIPEIKDKISRAFGILIHSYQIEAVEALNAISLLKLGLEVGWLDGVSIAELNELFFNCRRAHLLNQYSEKVPQDEVAHKRAEFIHKTLKEAKLTI